VHLSSETALDFVEGRLEKNQEGFWRGHLEICKDCRLDVGLWRLLGMDLKRSHLMSASEQDLEKAVRIFHPRLEKSGSKLRQLLATVIFDSFHEPAFAGARGATAATARQLIMRAEEFDIHIKIWGEHDRKQMLGQLLPRASETFIHMARFHLLRNGERLDSTAVDEMGEFHFRDVPDGDLSLQIDLPNLTVVGALKVRELS
jgi:hypothetical protein